MMFSEFEKTLKETVAAALRGRSIEDRIETTRRAKDELLRMLNDVRDDECPWGDIVQCVSDLAGAFVIKKAHRVDIEEFVRIIYGRICMDLKRLEREKREADEREKAERENAENEAESASSVAPVSNESVPADIPVSQSPQVEDTASNGHSYSEPPAEL